MRSDNRGTVALLFAFGVALPVAADAVTSRTLAAAARSPALAPRPSGSPPSTVAQEPPAIEASLTLDRPTTRLIQEGLRNEGFDPGEPDGLFGPRTRAAIRRWQEARGAPPTGFLVAAEAEFLTAASERTPSPSAATATTSTSPAGSDSTVRNPDALASEPLATPDNPNPTIVDAQRTADDARHPEPQPGTRTPATAPAQLPPAILLDSYLLRAEQWMRENHHADARATMAQIDALQAEHAVETPADYHYRFALIWTALDNAERAQVEAVRYLESTGQDGEHYLGALTLMNRATAALEELEAERERLLTEEARRRAADARARAEQERATSAARALTARLEFSTIPAGQFRMGLSEDGLRRIGALSSDNGWRRQTEVTISRPFEIGRYEVTQGEWETVMGSNPSSFSGCPRCPVEMVTWEEVQRFLSILNIADPGREYRLPTEAQWQYAARAGDTREHFVDNSDEYAWHRDNSGRRTHPVGLKRPNRFGLYDMFGNVEELTQDWAAPLPGGRVVDPTGPSSPRRAPHHILREKVVRGCSFLHPPAWWGVADRDTYDFDYSSFGSYTMGFRLVRNAGDRTEP